MARDLAGDDRAGEARDARMGQAERGGDGEEPDGHDVGLGAERDGLEQRRAVQAIQGGRGFGGDRDVQRVGDGDAEGRVDALIR